MPLLWFLDRERTIAPAGFNRWRVPPSALAIHLAIGQAYAFSVFNLPLSTLNGIDAPAADDWKLTTIGWIFSVAIVFLGLSAFTFGRWLERAGPRKAMFASATCFGGGFVVAAVGVQLHQIWLVYFGYGVIGGIGLGLGYISPVSTLIKWFPDRPGMATGLAIMGFGGGAMIGSPLAVALMSYFKSSTSMGVAPTFAVLGAVYFLFMMFGVITVRLPAPGWAPVRVPGHSATRAAPGGDVHVDRAIRSCATLPMSMPGVAAVGCQFCTLQVRSFSALIRSLRTANCTKSLNSASHRVSLREALSSCASWSRQSNPELRVKDWIFVTKSWRRFLTRARLRQNAPSPSASR